MVRTRALRILKLRVEDQPSGRSRFSVEFLENPVAQLFFWTAKVHRPDGVRTKHCIHPFEPPAYK
jgi:hypothetical protein